MIMSWTHDNTPNTVVQLVWSFHVLHAATLAAHYTKQICTSGSHTLACQQITQDPFCRKRSPHDKMRYRVTLEEGHDIINMFSKRQGEFPLLALSGIQPLCYPCTCFMESCLQWSVFIYGYTNQWNERLTFFLDLRDAWLSECVPDMRQSFFFSAWNHCSTSFRELHDILKSRNLSLIRGLVGRIRSQVRLSVSNWIV